MAERLVSQAPIQPAAATEADLYTCPVGYEGVCSSIIVCNTSTTLSDTFRIRKAVGGAATNTNQSWYNDAPIGPGETIIVSPAGTFKGTDKVRVRSTSGQCTFDYNGTEIA